MKMEFEVQGMDFNRAGEAAAQIKKALQMVGMKIETIRKTVIVAYEAELNIVIHAHKGILTAVLLPDRVEITASDEGPGIADISLALQEGYSTAPPHVREMGFGAGMGLPNIQRSSDKLDIESRPGYGTTVTAVIINGPGGE